MGQQNAETGGRLAGAGMTHHKDRVSRAGVMVQQPALDIERRTGMGLGQEADMDVPQDQGGGRIGALDRIETGGFGQIGDRLGQAGQIEADIEMAQLIAFPGVHIAAPEFDHDVRPPCIPVSDGIYRNGRNAQPRIARSRTLPAC